MTHHCSLCGYRFDEAEMAEKGCVTCAASPGGCGLVRCPSCGYEWPPESGSVMARLVRKLLPGSADKEPSREDT